MALRIDKAITEALDAARNGETVDLSQITIPRLSGGHLIKAVGDAAEMIRDFFLSDKSVDRDRDTLDPNGWDLKQFKQNGAVLWAHNASMPPIAEPMSTRVEGKGDGAKLFSGARFIDSDPMSKSILNLIDEKILKAVSVGFLPVEWVFVEERRGIDFSKQKLVEFSPVPVGSHPGAMVQLAKAKGIDLLPMLEWSQRWLDNDELVGKAVADDVEVAAICKALSPYAVKSDAGVIFNASGAPSTKTQDVVDPIIGPEAKAGRVLSKKNKAKLAKASELVLEVLAAAEKEEDDDGDGKAPTAEAAVSLMDLISGELKNIDVSDDAKDAAAAGLSAARDALDPPELEPLTREQIAAQVREAMGATNTKSQAEQIADSVREQLAAERKAESEAETLRQTGRLPH